MGREDTKLFLGQQFKSQSHTNLVKLLWSKGLWALLLFKQINFAKINLVGYFYRWKSVDSRWTKMGEKQKTTDPSIPF